MENIDHVAMGMRQSNKYNALTNKEQFNYITTTVITI